MSDSETSAALVVAAGDDALSPVAWPRADLDPAAVYVSALGTEKSRRAQRGALATIAALLGFAPDAVPWAQLRYQHCNAIRTRLVERYAPATANRFLAAMRGVLREARRLGLMSAEDCAAACDLRPARGSRLPKGRSLSRAELRRLFRACAADPKAGRRDAAMLALSFGGGLRRAELVGLDLADWNPDEGSLRVMGKGSKERLSYVVAGRPQLDAWLEQRGAEPGPLFWAVDHGGGLRRHRLTDHAVLLVFKRMAERANVPPFAPHDLRRSAISHLLDEGVDLAAAQRFAGHASPNTTARYDRRGEAAVKAAAAKLRF
jgi:site-specific recombinase XerD